MKIDDFILNHPYRDYCEAIIFPDGNIENADPSHLEKLIKYYISLHDCTRDDIYWKFMKPSDAPIDWLVRNTGCVSVWYKGYTLPPEPTDGQVEAIAKLITSDIILSRNIEW